MATLATNGSSQLSPAERAAILAALEEYTNALAIYHSTLKKTPERDNDIPVDCIYSDTNDLEISNMQLSPDDIARIKDETEQAASAKLYEDSSYIRKIMAELKREMHEQGSFEVLTKEIEKLIACIREERALLAKSEKFEKLVAELEKTIANEKIANEAEKKRVLNELAEEQRDIEQLKLIADVELEYVTAWEKARYEQNALRGDMEIEKLERILNDCRVREKNDERVHNELTKFLIQETASFEKKAREWEERYVREKEMYEKEIRQLRWEIKTRRKELEELKGEYRRNQEFIDTYLAEKETLRKQKEQKERALRSAVKVQAWWRGVMVRRKLGPYQPEEKKKKRPAKTKK